VIGAQPSIVRCQGARRRHIGLYAERAQRSQRVQGPAVARMDLLNRLLDTQAELLSSALAHQHDLAGSPRSEAAQAAQVHATGQAPAIGSTAVPGDLVRAWGGPAVDEPWPVCTTQGLLTPPPSQLPAGPGVGTGTECFCQATASALVAWPIRSMSPSYPAYHMAKPPSDPTTVGWLTKSVSQASPVPSITTGLPG
jgi:hypothetical protein